MATKTTRRYRKRRRAEHEAETRLRITEAAMRLHGTVGPARTTVKAVADEAGVQRATVYRHFPDTESLFEACSAHFYSLHPMPDPGRWRRIADPDARLRQALGELYDWYAVTEEMLTNVIRDASHVPPGTRVGFLRYFESVEAALVRGRRERGGARRRAAAAIGHAISFQTWRSLCDDHGLRTDDAVALMTALVAAAPGVRGG